MEIIKRNILFFNILFCLILIISISIVMIIINAKHMCQLKNHFFVLKSELESLLCYSPSPIKKNVIITTINLEQFHNLHNEWCNIIGKSFCSETPIECYWNIQKEVESIKNQAKAANVIINSKCDFGFLHYLNGKKLPEVDNLQNLDFECQIIKMLSIALIQSNPSEIINLASESKEDERELEDNFLKSRNLHNRNLHDIFYLRRYKLSFTGTTQSLRLFINKIESMQIPLFIRNLQVTKQSGGHLSLINNEGLAVFSMNLELFDFKITSK